MTELIIKGVSMVLLFLVAIVVILVFQAYRKGRAELRVKGFAIGAEWPGRGEKDAEKRL